MKLIQLSPILHFTALSSALTLPLNRRFPCEEETSHNAPLLATLGGSVFDVDVTVGADNQAFKLLVDTGSSDTYIMRDGFTCINATDNQIIAPEDCKYGPETYHVSSSYEQVPDQNFGIEYGAGLASGVMAYETITIADITVRTKLAFADRSNPMGDGVNNGLLGLGYPSLTSAHPGTSTPNDTYFYNRAVYNPVVNEMYEQGLIEEPYFSIALAHTARDSTEAFGGYISLGELPPVELASEFTTVPVEIMENIPINITSDKRQISYWAFTTPAVKYGPAEEEEDALVVDNTPFQLFIDTGNEFSILPTAVVDPVNTRFEPPAVYNDELKAYIVDCGAKPPVFGVVVGNQTFYHAPEDLIYNTGNGYCVSTLVPSEKNGRPGLVINILGVPFFKNLVAVFDFGNDEMRFARVSNGYFL
ncbi:aspartic peptidase domain-containing protein [Aspergillus parasiticus]|uniref:Aspartic peptidase domain-containing protein n=1 Tax=Aspergillus parasiticus TaxID=5067 RepID=A0A5N6DN24_ASPPA|nr:aspartic peptidase domain-containing protein [Aspergillus parasiticus]